jgi:hypothetical protein
MAGRRRWRGVVAGKISPIAVLVLGCGGCDVWGRRRGIPIVELLGKMELTHGPHV